MKGFTVPEDGGIFASDIEAIGFYDVIFTANDIHCICSINIFTHEVYLFHNRPEFDGVEVLDPHDGKTYTIPIRSGTLDDGIKFWEEVSSKGGKLLIHNAHTYDRPVVDKIWPGNKISFDCYHDTFIQSKVQWFERPCPKGARSPHGLQAYGIKLGINKPEVKDWSFINAFKLHRGIEDCKIQAGTYNILEKERQFFKDTFDADFTQALKIEALYAKECDIQERNGALVDVPYIKECVEDLDTKIEELRAEVEPLLPPTLKGKGTKMSAREVAEALEHPSASKIKDKFIKKKKDGEVVDALVKPYFKPCTKYTTCTKSNQYQGYHIDNGESSVFDKKNLLTKWIKENYPETKVKDWSIDKTVKETYAINANNCKHFGIKPDSTDLLCGPHTKITIEPSKMTQDVIVKGYLIKCGWHYADEWNLKTDVHDKYIKVEEETEIRWPPRANPDDQLVKIIPKGGYLVSSPKLTEDDYKQLPEGVGQKIAHYNTYQHRRRFLENPKDPENKGLLSYVRKDGRIPCGVNNFGTRSGRGSQRVWVNAPGPKSLYGKEIRKCLVAPEGKVLVGVDMKSAQLSIAAYYANNAKYYNNVATGLEFTDDEVYVGETAHCVNARMFGMVTEEQWKEAVRTQDPDLIEELTLIRGNSKGGSFAVLFGGSGKKVAVTIGIPEKEGHKRKEQFLKQMGLGDTISQLSVFESMYPHRHGFMLPLAFGYWLWNNSSHKSVNTIVQGFEALAQKLAVVRFAKEVERKGWGDVMRKVLDVHDECLLEVDKGMENDAGTLMGDSYTWAAEQIFNFHVKNPHQFANPEPPLFKIDLNGGYKVGDTYYDVH